MSNESVEMMEEAHKYLVIKEDEGNMFVEITKGGNVT